MLDYIIPLLLGGQAPRSFSDDGESIFLLDGSCSLPGIFLSLVSSAAGSATNVGSLSTWEVTGDLSHKGPSQTGFGHPVSRSKMLTDSQC